MQKTPAGTRNPKPDLAPDRFVRCFVIVAVVSFFVVLGLASMLIVRHNGQNLLRDAEIYASRVSEAIRSEMKDTITVSLSRERSTLVIPREQLPQLDRQIRNFLQPLEIVKVKIYDADKTIIYCTEKSLIGKTDRDNSHLDRALSGSAASRFKKKQNVLDLADEKRLDMDIAETYVPVRDSFGKVAGVFEVYLDVSRINDEFSKNLKLSLLVLGLIIIMVELFSYIIIRKEANQLREAQELLTALASTDPLTGLYNRRHIMARLEEEFSKLKRLVRAGRNGDEALGCIMIDADNFKRINDQHGHFVGDEVLVEMSVRISSSLRQYDIAARYGGEEFIILLPSVTRDGLTVVAQRILERIRSESFNVDNTLLTVTASLGTSWSGFEEEGMANLLKRADASLYQAKAKGRNMIIESRL